VESFPAPPVVHMQLEIRNRSDGEVEIWLGGDDCGVTLELSGPGAVNVSNPGPFTNEPVYSRPVRLAPGGKYVQPLDRLGHVWHPGFWSQSYWTEPGDYTLVAHYQLGAPASTTPELYRDPPAGPKLTSQPIRIMVQEL
jgi:hypothetical protein